MAKLPELLVRWEYCKVATHVYDWSGMNGPRGVVLRMLPSDPPRDFMSIDHALEEMGLNGWECFHIEKSPSSILTFQTVTLRFKRPLIEVV